MGFDPICFAGSYTTGTLEEMQANTGERDERVSVEGLRVEEINGRRYFTLSGEMDVDELASRLVKEWVPYVECHQCGRYRSCRFSTANPGVESEWGEIRCGVTKTALENFVTRTFHIFKNLDQRQRQDYLNGAFHFTRYVHKTEQMIGMQISEPHLDYWDDLIPYVFGQFTRLRRRLDGFAAAMASIPAFNTIKDVLLVEGWSEKILFERLRTSGISWFTDLLVETYEGRARRGPSHLQLLIKHFHDTGYQVYISGDADGRATNIFDALIGQNLVAPAHTHVFSYDLETGVPPRLLYLGLRELDLLSDVMEESFCNQLKESDGSVIQTLQTGFGITLEPLKLKVAEAMGVVMTSDEWSWWKDDEFMDSEFGQLIRLVQKME